MVLVKMRETCEQFFNKKVKYVIRACSTNRNSLSLATLSLLFPPTLTTHNDKRPRMLVRSRVLRCCG